MPRAARSLVIDNYDSFTWNLVQLMREIGDDPLVLRNDEIEIDHLTAARRLLVSPGPGRPEGAGRCLELTRRAMKEMPVLGVCLGHQSLGHLHGIEVVRAPKPVHGKISLVEHDGSGLFAGVRNPFRAMRYHSLLLRMSESGSDLEVTATTMEDGVELVMGLRHRDLPVAGVQFHPESFLTEDGRCMMENFLSW